MPNLKRVKTDIAKWKKALGSLQNGKPVEIEGRLLLPSMEEGGGESDLTTCERMIERLTGHLKAAKSQAHRKGLTEDGEATVIHAAGVSALLEQFNLTEADLLRIVPTGDEGRMSKRDVRSYARAKIAGNVEGYLKKALLRSGLAESDIVAKITEIIERSEVVEVPEEEEIEEVKPLDEMTAKELGAECEKRGIEIPKGKKSVVLQAILDHDAKAEETGSEEEPEEGGEEDSNVNPLA